MNSVFVLMLTPPFAGVFRKLLVPQILKREETRKAKSTLVTKTMWQTWLTKNILTRTGPILLIYLIRISMRGNAIVCVPQNKNSSSYHKLGRHHMTMPRRSSLFRPTSQLLLPQKMMLKRKRLTFWLRRCRSKDRHANTPRLKPSWNKSNLSQTHQLKTPKLMKETTFSLHRKVRGFVSGRRNSKFKTTNLINAKSNNESVTRDVVRTKLTSQRTAIPFFTRKWSRRWKRGRATNLMYSRKSIIHSLPSRIYLERKSTNWERCISNLIMDRAWLWKNIW